MSAATFLSFGEFQMKFTSAIVACGAVQFPAFMAERVYMREFYKDKGLPDELSRWQPTVDQMLEGVDTDGPIYIMIDQGIVKGGSTHRREGIHIDGYWNPAISAHGTGHVPTPGGHGSSGGGHRSIPRRRHHESIPWGIIREGHYPASNRHSAGAQPWMEAEFKEPEGLILASDIPACMGYNGEFQGPIGEGGDCSHVDLTTMDGFLMDAGVTYAGNVTCLHQSVPLDHDCQRTLVRLNVPGWTI
jgi:hypothetical protein